MEAMAQCPTCASRAPQNHREPTRDDRSPASYCGQFPSLVYVPVAVFPTQSCQKCEEMRLTCSICGQTRRSRDRKGRSERQSLDDHNGGSAQNYHAHRGPRKLSCEELMHRGAFSPILGSLSPADPLEQCQSCGHISVVKVGDWNRRRISTPTSLECPGRGTRWKSLDRCNSPSAAGCPGRHPHTGSVTPCWSVGHGSYCPSHQEMPDEGGERMCQHYAGGYRQTKPRSESAQNSANAESLKTQRRLSADSGRITWSDSGESAFSDFQPGEWSHRVATPSRRATSTGSCDGSSAGLKPNIRHSSSGRESERGGQLTPNMRTPDSPQGAHGCEHPRRYRKYAFKSPPESAKLLKPSAGNMPGVVHSTSAPSFNSGPSNPRCPTPCGRTNSPQTQSSSEPQDDENFVFSFKIPVREEHQKNDVTRGHYHDGCARQVKHQQDEIPSQLERGLPRQIGSRSTHDCAMFSNAEDAPRRTRSVALPPSRDGKRVSLTATQGDIHGRSGEFLPKYNQQMSLIVGRGDLSPVGFNLRPRSRSMFVASDAQRDYWAAAGSQLATFQESVLELEKPDFTTWKRLVSVREIHGDKVTKEGIKAYGITALAGNEGIGVTDADKVKIKIYDINGELKHSFGTPTWPRYGRGIATMTDGRVAVCHLTEVCVYSTDGKLIARHQKDEFNSCWGIACDIKGNLVVTDPKSSAVFILNPEGNIVTHIGRSTPLSSRTKSNSCKNVRKSSSWKNNLSIKAFRPSRKRRDTHAEGTEHELNTRSDSTCRLSNLSLPPNQVAEELSVSAKPEKQVRLLAPRYVTVNSKNQILVTDTKQRCLLVFEQSGKLLFSIGGGRLGCKQCSKGRRAGRKGSDWSPDFVQIAETTSLPDTIGCTPPAKEKSPEKKVQHKERPHHNVFSDICNYDICAMKQERVRVLGTMYRGDMARNESVESEAYLKREATFDHSDPTVRVQNSTDHPSKSPRPTRFHGQDRTSFQEECSSYIDVPIEKKENNFLKPLTKLTRNISRRMSKSKSPLWVRRNKKKSDAKIPDDDVGERLCAPLGRCNSLKSIEDEEDYRERVKAMPDKDNANNISPVLECGDLPCDYSTPHTDAQSPASSESLSGKEKTSKDQSSGQSSKEPFASPDDSLEDSRTAYSFNLNEYSIISSETDSEEYWNEEGECPDGNEQRTACRRCHVEDPRGVCVDQNDNILLVDRARNRISVFVPDGHFVRHILTEEDGLVEPMAACVLHDGSLAVIDSSSIIKVFKFSSSE